MSDYRNLKISRAIVPYSCAECGEIIQGRTVYFRDETHPLAGHHRGEQVRHLCTNCVTGRPPSDFGQPPKLVTSQLTLLFPEAAGSLPGLLVQAIVSLGERTADGHIVEAVT